VLRATSIATARRAVHGHGPVALRRSCRCHRAALPARAGFNLTHYRSVGRNLNETIVRLWVLDDPARWAPTLPCGPRPDHSRAEVADEVGISVRLAAFIWSNACLGASLRRPANVTKGRSLSVTRQSATVRPASSSRCRSRPAGTTSPRRSLGRGLGRSSSHLPHELLADVAAAYGREVGMRRGHTAATAVIDCLLPRARRNRHRYRLQMMPSPCASAMQCRCSSGFGGSPDAGTERRSTILRRRSRRLPPPDRAVAEFGLMLRTHDTTEVRACKENLLRSLRDFGESHAVAEVLELADEVVAPLVGVGARDEPVAAEVFVGRSRW
jgi:hypothetical protein